MSGRKRIIKYPLTLSLSLAGERELMEKTRLPCYVSLR
jgi:hypothetical protein